MNNFDDIEYNTYSFSGRTYTAGTTQVGAGLIIDQDNDNVFQADGSETKRPLRHLSRAMDSRIARFSD